MHSELGAIFRRAFVELDDLDAALQVTVDTMLGLSASRCGVEPLAIEIARTTAGFYGLTLAQLKSRSRAYLVSRPRSVSWWLMRQMVKTLSYPAMGKILGGFDHTTVIYAVKMVERRPLLLAEAATIRNRIQAHAGSSRP